MEVAPDTDNVAFIDEYPELQRRVQLRRQAEQRSGQVATARLIIFPALQGVR